MSRPRVYIGRLSPRAREHEVERFFQGYGKIRDIMLKNGFGFVELEDYRDADDAIHDLNGKLLCGERVVLEIAKGTPRGAGGAFVSGYNPPPSSAKYYKESSHKSSSHGSGRPGFGRPQNGYKLIVENLSSRYNWQDLKDLMVKCGEINYVDAHHYRRNEGVVEFARKKDMEYAMKKFQGKAVNGRKIKLTPETSKYSRSPTPVRHHSRSSSRGKRSSKRSRTRSRSRSRRGSKDADRKRYRSRSYSGSPPLKKSTTADRDASASPAKSRDASPDDRGRSRSKDRRSRSKSRSTSPNGNGFRSRSHTGSPDRASKSASRSRSRSRSS